ncbi:MAG: HDOD domain-containing protein [Planctomycetota bacterium]
MPESSGSSEKAGVLSIENVMRSESLPTLPAVAMELLQRTSNPDVSLDEIANLIQSDPGLAAKVLKTVNSSFYGLPTPCPSIDRAIKMLGLRAVKSLVLGFSILNLNDAVGERIELEAFWKHTVFASAGARQIAKRMDLAEPDEVFAAALFQDMGVLALLSAEMQAYGPVFVNAQGSHARLHELERTQLEIDHAELGALIAERWRMPGLISNVVRYHHRPTAAPNHLRVVQAVGLGQLAAAAIEGLEDGAVDTFIDEAVHQLEIEPADVPDLLEDIRQASREIARVLDQQLGEVPSVQEIMGRAGQMLVEHQMRAEQETMQAQQRAVEAEHMATTDGLTGVGNRKKFDTLVHQQVAEAYSAGTPIATLFSDADKFKFVNDTYGHHVGDAVLIELARRLTDALGERGTVCRYGGEEFAVVVPGVTRDQATAIGEELRQAICSTPFDLAGVEDAPPQLDRTVSVGVSGWSAGQPQVPALDLVQQADKAVYLAKESGRNNVKTWGVDLQADASSTEPALSLAPASSPESGALAGEIKLDLLLIEDDPLAAKLMQMMFLRTGRAEVAIANDGREAVQVLRECAGPDGNLPDLIICDLNLPEFNGLQILKALKANERFAHIPIYMVSGSENADEVKACLDAGAAEFFNKIAVGKDMKNWCEQIVRTLPVAA